MAEYETRDSKYSPGGIQRFSTSGRNWGGQKWSSMQTTSFVGKSSEKLSGRYEERNVTPNDRDGKSIYTSGSVKKKSKKYANVSSRLFQPTKAATMKSRRIEHKTTQQMYRE